MCWSAFRRFYYGWTSNGSGHGLFDCLVITGRVSVPVLDQPLLALSLALLLAAGLLGLAAGGPEATISPAQVEAWEGSTVTVAGVVAAAYPAPDGSLRLLLADGDQAVWVSVDRSPPVARGSWAEIEGRVWRRGVDLEVAAVPGGFFRVGPPPYPFDPGWPQVAADPENWSQQPLRLAGLVEDDHLTDGAGRSLLLGSGGWPDEGPVVATGAIAYTSSCLCYRFDAARVDVPWMSSSS